MEIRYSIQALMGERWQEIYTETERSRALRVAAGQLPRWGRVRVVLELSHREVVQEFAGEAA